VRGEEGGWWARGNAAGERGVVMDVEFEEMEEGVCYEGDWAVEFCGHGEISFDLVRLKLID
jgi:hypothetical protein